MAENPMTSKELASLKRMVRVITRLQTPIYKLTGGRVWGAMAGRDVCLVTMTGAKSGRKRTIPVMYVPHGQGVLVVGSLGGAPHDPVWVRNLDAHPEVEVHHRGRKLKLRARRVEGEERAHLWPTCVQHYPPYADYQKRTDREIPVFACEPY